MPDAPNVPAPAAAAALLGAPLGHDHACLAWIEVTEVAADGVSGNLGDRAGQRDELGRDVPRRDTTAELDER